MTAVSSAQSGPPTSITARLRSLGRTLRFARNGRGFSLVRQAGRAGLTASTVERIERGDCTASFGEVVALCASLDLSLVVMTPEPCAGDAARMV